MADLPQGECDLDRAIRARLGSEPDAETHAQALAILIDADLTEEDRANAFQTIMSSLLAQLSADELDRFRQIAHDDGEVAAMSYLGAVTRPMSNADRT